MAYIVNTHIAGFNFTSRFTAFVEGVKAATQRHRAYSLTVRELNSLDNRDLADLGISRSEITSVARKHVYDL